MQVVGYECQLSLFLAERIVEKIVPDRALMGCDREYLADNASWRKLQVVYPQIKREQLIRQALKAGYVSGVLPKHGGHCIGDR
jgi:hypothetical protein